MSGFDLSAARETLDREDEGQVVHLHDEAGAPMFFGENNQEPVTVTVAGTYSKRYRKAFEAKLGKLSGRSRAPDTAQRDALDVIAQCVIGWSGFFENGEPIECTRANVLRVIELAVWIRVQVEQAMEDHAAFSRASSPS